MPRKTETRSKKKKAQEQSDSDDWSPSDAASDTSEGSTDEFEEQSPWKKGALAGHGTPGTGRRDNVPDIQPQAPPSDKKSVGARGQRRKAASDSKSGKGSGSDIATARATKRGRLSVPKDAPPSSDENGSDDESQSEHENVYGEEELKEKAKPKVKEPQGAKKDGAAGKPPRGRKKKETAEERVERLHPEVRDGLFVSLFV